MDSVIISSIIEAISLIAVAFIGTKGVNKAIKEKHFEGFDMFSSKKHKYTFLEMLLNAKHDIYIVVAIGNILFKEYEYIFKHLMKHGVKIHVLILSDNRLDELCEFINNFDGRNERELTINLLNDLKNNGKDYFEWKEIDSLMTVSFIGVDLDTYPSSYYKDSSMIQMMNYVWNTPTKDSTISFIDPQIEKEHFKIIRKSILEMWGVGK